MEIFDYLKIVCGLALFLYGMSVMSDGLKKSAGSRLKTILGKMTANPVKGFLLGVGVTAVVQSSSATTVMIVGFVNSGTMTLLQSVGVTMGANVGAAVTYWLTALSSIGEGVNVAEWLNWLKPSSWMPLLAISGAGIRMFSKRGKTRDIALILLGFSVLMVGMEEMSAGAMPLKSDPNFTNLLTLFDNPFFGLLAGTLITAAVQSSAASVGILQSLAVSGAISWSAAFPIILGQNIGTCITALLSSIGAGKNAKRSAFIHLYFNVVGGIFFLLLYRGFSLITDIPLFAKSITAFDIALVHTVIKILYVALLAPFSRMLVKLAELTVKDKDGAEDQKNLLDERLMNTPAIAVNRATEVTGAMAEISVRALMNALTLLDNGYDPKVAEEVRADENRADIYEDTIGTYLVKLSGCSTDLSDSHQITELLHMIGDFERISDHAVNLVESAEEMAEKKIVFSEEARREIKVLRSAVGEILNLASRAFLYNDFALAACVEPLEQVVDDLRDQIKRNHILRLQKSECTIEHGFVLSDILTNCERVSDHCSNIAGCVLEIQHDELDMHRYLDSVKEGSPEFDRMYHEYREKYSL